MRHCERDRARATGRPPPTSIYHVQEAKKGVDRPVGAKNLIAHMHPAMAEAMATESSQASALFYGAGGIALGAARGDEEEGGFFGRGFSSARPAVVTQQLFPTTTAAAQQRQQAVERCVLAGAAVAAGAGRWARPASRAKSRRGPRSRSSQYRGVTFYRRTGRWESHIWYASLLF